MTLLTTQMRYLHRSPFEIEGVGIELPALDEPHPNRVPFTGILTKLDQPSTRPPGGSSGHKVLIPRAVAEAALPSLIGMPVNFSSSFEDHDKRQPIGTIAEAHIRNDDLVVSGYLYGKNFPNEVDYIKANKSQLGMSYEISDVQVDSVDAAIWTLNSLVFTGAAVLLKDKAAYAKTAIAAKAEEKDVKQVTEELQKLNAKLDGIQAAMAASEDADAARRDEDEATSQDAAAATALTAAQRAQQDGDDEEAARHEAAAGVAHMQAAKARMQAAAWHTAQAQACTAAGETDAAQEHAAAAQRLTAAAATSQQAAADLTAAQEARQTAAAKPDEDDDQYSAMARMMGTFLRALHGSEAEAAGEANPLKRKNKPLEEDMLARMFGAMMAMTFRPGMYTGTKKLAAQHDDEEQDKALIRRMLQQDKGQGSLAASHTDLLVHRRLRNIEASMELLTDTLKKVTTLLTDGPQPRTGLATDRSAGGANGGAAPQRRSMQATGGELWVDKFAGRRDPNGHQGKKTEAEVTRELIEQGITDPRVQMAHLIDLRAAGGLA